MSPSPVVAQATRREAGEVPGIARHILAGLAASGFLAAWLLFAAPLPAFAAGISPSLGSAPAATAVNHAVQTASKPVASSVSAPARSTVQTASKPVSTSLSAPATSAAQTASKPVTTSVSAPATSTVHTATQTAAKPVTRTGQAIAPMTGTAGQTASESSSIASQLAAPAASLVVQLPVLQSPAGVEWPAVTTIDSLLAPMASAAGGTVADTMAGVIGLETNPSAPGAPVIPSALPAALSPPLEAAAGPAPGPSQALASPARSPDAQGSSEPSLVNGANRLASHVWIALSRTVHAIGGLVRREGASVSSGLAQLARAPWPWPLVSTSASNASLTASPGFGGAGPGGVIDLARPPLLMAWTGLQRTALLRPSPAFLSNSAPPG